MKRFFRGFIYALNGIRRALCEERNLRLHSVTAVLVLALSGFYDFTRAEYIIMLILIGGVLALELTNSAIERSVDKPSELHYYSAGAAKDMAAGAVLVFSIVSAVGGVLLFWDTAVFDIIVEYFSANPIFFVAYLSLFLAGYVWAFRSRKEDK